ncbi:uncharacterized protein H6S33_007964 [Morchella sextelata]|uniref:uncharacterized protein n=1 Tax=Morchella sextelata TaxID=1174677 RepID=UPI001D03FFCB|nr:uncharacterized protein H6S33_007964 [Morchella sextelata]KAH0602960.1 hypothetical protein H6S33_007964 [Morchella sextelata]
MSTSAILTALRTDLSLLREILTLHITAYNSIDSALVSAIHLSENDLRARAQDMFPGEIRNDRRVWPQILECMGGLKAQIRCTEMNIALIERDIRELEARGRSSR